jgi:hypothetical protein
MTALPARLSKMMKTVSRPLLNQEWTIVARVPPAEDEIDLDREIGRVNTNFLGIATAGHHATAASAATTSATMNVTGIETVITTETGGIAPQTETVTEIGSENEAAVRWIGIEAGRTMDREAMKEIAVTMIGSEETMTVIGEVRAETVRCHQGGILTAETITVLGIMARLAMVRDLGPTITVPMVPTLPATMERMVHLGAIGIDGVHLQDLHQVTMTKLGAGKERGVHVTTGDENQGANEATEDQRQSNGLILSTKFLLIC